MRGEEVKKIIEDDGIPLNELADSLEISPQNLNNWLNVKDIKTGILEKIAKAINKNIYYFIDNQSNESAGSFTPSKDIIRYYEIDASAGPVEMFDYGNNSSYKELIIPGFEDCDIALNVWGDSMEPALSSGEIILCKEWKENFIEYGYIYLIITRENHRMIKYIQPGSVADKISCESKNSFYKPFEVSKTDILKLFVIKGHIERSAI
jgi:phage repressor protein C with HTH and peptisase S24 domain